MEKIAKHKCKPRFQSWIRQATYPNLKGTWLMNEWQLSLTFCILRETMLRGMHFIWITVVQHILNAHHHFIKPFILLFLSFLKKRDVPWLMVRVVWCGEDEFLVLLILSAFFNQVNSDLDIPCWIFCVFWTISYKIKM